MRQTEPEIERALERHLRESNHCTAMPRSFARRALLALLGACWCLALAVLLGAIVRG